MTSADQIQLIAVAKDAASEGLRTESAFGLYVQAARIIGELDGAKSAVDCVRNCRASDDMVRFFGIEQREVCVNEASEALLNFGRLAWLNEIDDEGVVYGYETAYCDGFVAEVRVQLGRRNEEARERIRDNVARYASEDR